MTTLGDRVVVMLTVVNMVAMTIVKDRMGMAAGDRVVVITLGNRVGVTKAENGVVMIEGGYDPSKEKGRDDHSMTEGNKAREVLVIREVARVETGW